MKEITTQVLETLLKYRCDLSETLDEIDAIQNRLKTVYRQLYVKQLIHNDVLLKLKDFLDSDK